jgi:hypothetical protein
MDLAAIAAAPAGSGYADSCIGAAAELQALGKDKACARLRELARHKDEDERERVFVLCRMLFVAKPGLEFRRPLIGFPHFIGGGEDWPLEPIALVDGVPFYLVYGYSLAGYPEPAPQYVEYCIAECDWSPTRFVAKTAAEKRAALIKLFSQNSFSQDEKRFLAAQIQ